MHFIHFLMCEHVQYSFNKQINVNLKFIFIITYLWILKCILTWDFKKTEKINEARKIVETKTPFSCESREESRLEDWNGSGQGANGFEHFFDHCIRHYGVSTFSHFHHLLLCFSVIFFPMFDVAGYQEVLKDNDGIIGKKFYVC